MGWPVEAEVGDGLVVLLPALGELIEEGKEMGEEAEGKEK